MTMDEQHNIRPTDNTPADTDTAQTQPTEALPPTERPSALSDDDDRMSERLERLGGEPAPVITPEEFARLQQAGQVHIDALGRIQTARRSDAEAGVSLRKRRAWYR